MNNYTEKDIELAILNSLKIRITETSKRTCSQYIKEALTIEAELMAVEIRIQLLRDIKKKHELYKV